MPSYPLAEAASSALAPTPAPAGTEERSKFIRCDMPALPIQVLSLIGLVIAFILASGCAFDEFAEAEQCDHDADCTDEDYCIGAQCVSRCAHDEECPNNTYCQAYQRRGDAAPVQACIDADAHDAGGLECEEDAQCRDALDDPGAHCGMHGRCILSSEEGEPDQNGPPGGQNSDNDDVQAPTRHILKIEQLDADGLPVSLDDLSPDDGTRPDPRAVNLGAVLVRDEHHTAVGFGTLLHLESDEEADSPELATAPVTLDDSGACVEDPADAPYTSLNGPGGRAWIDLIDGQYHPVDLGEDQRLQIVADGPECPLGGEDADDEADDDVDWGQYRVRLCKTDLSAEVPDIIELDCHRILGDELTHFSELEVTTDQ